MQKKIIALAIAGLVSGAAFAQSNVTIYGRVDYGFVHQSGNNGGVAGIDGTNKFDGGVQAGNRIGFRGNEDLGNGNKLIFQYEYGTGLEQNVGLTTIRNAYVGFTGKWGTAVGGRLDGVRYGIFNKYDAFAGGTVGNFTQMTSQVDRANNAVAYISPTFGGGFTFTGAYATNIGSSTNILGLAADETNGNKLDGQLYTLMLNYANGPIELTADWERVNFDDFNLAVPATSIIGAAAVPLDRDTVTTLAGSYDFGVVKVRALWDKQKVETRGAGTAADIRSWFLSATAPLGANWLLKGTYGRTDDKQLNSDNARKWGLGVNYMLSKRTTIYADYGNIRQGSNSFVQVNAGANGYNGYLGQQGAGMSNGTNARGTTAFDIGVGHTF